MSDNKPKGEIEHPENGASADVPEGSGAASPSQEDDQPRVVYRRKEAGSGATQTDSLRATSIWARKLAPAVLPLIVGFLLLLLLISVLGVLSVQRMDEVSVKVLGLEQHHAAKLSLLLKLRLAVTKLNNEARARADSEARGGLRPPLDLRLNTAQDETDDLLGQVQRPPLSEDRSWRSFRNDLKEFIEVTKDLRRYSLEGFDKFNVVDAELDSFLQQSSEEQVDVVRQSEIIERTAEQSIQRWTVIALIVGALVAAGTIWEVQRRFGQMRRSMEEARRERIFTSQLLEGMVSAVAAIDEHDRIRSANAAFFKIFPGASIGASVYEKFASEASWKMLEAATGSRVDKATYRGRWWCPPSEEGGSEQAFDVYSSPVVIDDAHGQILTFVDATEVAEAERGLRQQESLAAVGQATAQVAHEIRNPLGSIRLGVSMLRDNIVDAEGLRTIDVVERGIMHLNKLVVDVSQFSRSKALEPSSVDLHDLIRNSLELVADKISEKDTQVQAKRVEQKVVGHWDGDQLSQVFVNVIANAIDASPKGAPISISTEVVNVSDGDESLSTKRFARIIIADQGQGMDKTTAGRIFEPFFSTKKRGTGLGLAIVKQIVEQHGGKISVESEPDKGTRFVIDLPL
jgi:nitrogen-specific signal transduction histidine kinase